ncbi:MAG: F0F1 ATP synthase subunit gamma [Actinomycetales bacterium]|nr:F0F1 ATP synthase subunit gamma [Actinomycetales bacterium]
MGAQQRVYRRRIKTVQSTKKITKAMELIASSRIVKAQQRVEAALPYTRELTRAISAAATHTGGGHPLTETEQRVQQRAAVLVITSDRGLAGAYSSSAIKEAEQLSSLIRERGMEVVPFLVGRKAVAYYKFRGRAMAASWTGFSDQPTYAHAKEIAAALLESFLSRTEDGGTDEIHVVYTHFQSMVTQVPTVRRILPLEVVEQTAAEAAAAGQGPFPLYEFEPSGPAVLDSLLPKYVENLVFTSLLLSAASEHAARRRAMKAATDNAEELIKTLSRQANQARQAEITQEISEIVGGADALSASA